MLKTAAEVAAELEEITDTMLAVARFEAGVEAPAMEPLDLVAALRRWVARVADTAARRGLHFDVDAPAELWVQADEQLLARIFANLAGNALRHAPAGDVVRVRAAAGADGARLELENRADHLADGDLQLLKQRFFRRPAPGSDGAGSGLGLGVVDALARLSGCGLELSLRDGRFVAMLTGLRPIEVS
jgi:signal transduction histidine kinase